MAAPSSAALCIHRAARAPPWDPPHRLSPLPRALSASLSHFPDGVPAIINPSCAKGWGCLEVGPQERVLPVPMHRWVGGTAAFGAVNPFLQPPRCPPMPLGGGEGNDGGDPPCGAGGPDACTHPALCTGYRCGSSRKIGSDFPGNRLLRGSKEQGSAGNRWQPLIPPPPPVAQPHDPQSAVLDPHTVPPEH